MSDAPPVALLKQQPADFQVDEVLGFGADGSGEHDLLHIRKTGANTAWVAAQLARHAGVAPVAVGYCGLKDRQAITTQWFSVQLPGRRCDWRALRLAGVEILEVARHSRKLPRGAHRGNTFRLRLRSVRLAPAVLETRLTRLLAEGAPNHFGEQRFGRGGHNLGLAVQAQAGVRLGREQRAFALSAQRAALFNLVLDARLAEGSWTRLLSGERAMLDGSHSVFGPITPDATLAERCLALDIHPTGPLPGAGDSGTAAECAALEAALLQPQDGAVQWLSRQGLKAQRRALRVRVAQLAWAWQDPGGDPALPDLCLHFDLPRGAYATSVVDHLLGQPAGEWSELPADST